jgi:hypothetical protein
MIKGFKGFQKGGYIRMYTRPSNPVLETFATHQIVQICWAVDDVDTAVDRWVKMMGAGPFFVMRHIPLVNVTYRGIPGTYDHSAALGQWGTVQIELHQQHCDSPSAARDLFAPGKSGILHMTWLVKDVDVEIRRMEELGFQTIFMCGSGTDLYTAWFDTRSVLGTYIEVYQGNPAIRQSYNAIRRASMGWNGENALRPMESLSEFLGS